jgi:hypothetical protein
MTLVVDIDEGNMLEPNNVKVAHWINIEIFLNVLSISGHC